VWVQWCLAICVFVSSAFFKSSMSLVEGCVILLSQAAQTSILVDHVFLFREWWIFASSFRHSDGSLVEKTT
jgi:hypothetical protein